MAGINQNHTYQDIMLDLGETWTIQGTLNKNNSPLTIDSNTAVQWRLANPKGIVLNLNLAQNISIIDIPTAAYRIVVPVSLQLSTVGLIPGAYTYELSVVQANGVVSIQAEGKATINTSLRYKYP